MGTIRKSESEIMPNNELNNCNDWMGNFESIKEEILQGKTTQQDLKIFIDVLQSTKSNELRDRLSVLLVDNFESPELYRTLLNLSASKELHDHNSTLLYALSEMGFNGSYLKELFSVFKEGDYSAAAMIVNILINEEELPWNLYSYELNKAWNDVDEEKYDLLDQLMYHKTRYSR